MRRMRHNGRGLAGFCRVSYLQLGTTLVDNATFRRWYLTKRAISPIYLKTIFSSFENNNKKIKNIKYKILITSAISLSILISTTFIAIPTAKADNLEILKLYAHTLLLNAKEFHCLDLLWTNESHWNSKARNKKSTAMGIPQILGMKEKDPSRQIRIGIDYIRHRYSTPCQAWNHWRKVGHY